MSENMFGSQTRSDVRITQIQKHLKQCTPEELQDELDALILSTDGSESDLELIDAYLAELDRRVPLEQEITMEESLKNFHEKHGMLLEETQQEPPKKRRRPGRYVALVAAVVVVVGLLAVQATGTELFGSLARWSDETFGISFGYQVDAMERDPEYLPLQQAVEEAGITVPLVPKYLPEGYVQTEMSVEEKGTILFARYICGKAEIGIRIQSKELNWGNDIQKTGKSPEVAEINGVDHYLFINDNTYMAVWENDGHTCMISGVVEKSDLYTMIDSIYTEDIQ